MDPLSWPMVRHNSAALLPTPLPMRIRTTHCAQVMPSPATLWFTISLAPLAMSTIIRSGLRCGE